MNETQSTSNENKSIVLTNKIIIGITARCDLLIGAYKACGDNDIDRAKDAIRKLEVLKFILVDYASLDPIETTDGLLDVNLFDYKRATTNDEVKRRQTRGTKLHGTEFSWQLDTLKSQIEYIFGADSSITAEINLIELPELPTLTKRRTTGFPPSITI